MRMVQLENASKTRLVIATTNPGKIREVELILNGHPFEVSGLGPLADHLTVGENADTFAGNAERKATIYSQLLPGYVLADDSGLVVDALKGEPGVRSNRFLGRDASDAVRNEAILARLRDVPVKERTAHFHCAVAIAIDGTLVDLIEDRCDGIIMGPPRGEHGFGYDPIFHLPDRGCTMAELAPEEKNEISHRGRAFRRALERLTELV